VGKKKTEKIRVDLGIPKPRSPHLPDKVVAPKKGGAYRRAKENRKWKEESND
jgi:hypothetical protein